MTRRHVSTEAFAQTSSAQGQPPKSASKSTSAGVWYLALISTVLLVAVGVYALSLQHRILELENTARQLEIGQDLLRDNRDEILAKGRSLETSLISLETDREREQIRLEGLEGQRERLQAEVVRLTQALAMREHERSGDTVIVADDNEAQSLTRDLAREQRETAELQSKLSNLVDQLADRQDLLNTLRIERDQAKDAQAAAEAKSAHLHDVIAHRRDDQRFRQILHGHRASLGDMKPYMAELTSSEWSIAEVWLAKQLSRPMAIPDLSAHEIFYEGARLLQGGDGPAMAMLLYQDAKERPVTLTIALDGTGTKPVSTRQTDGLRWLTWRENDHAFFLVGAQDQNVLADIAAGLIDEPPGLSPNSVVPVSRHFRPKRRPASAS